MAGALELTSSVQEGMEWGPCKPACPASSFPGTEGTEATWSFAFVSTSGTGEPCLLERQVGRHSVWSLWDLQLGD